MPMPKRENIAGFLAFALAVTSVTAVPEAHADMLKDFGASIKREVQCSAANGVSRSIEQATPASARRAATGLPGQTAADRPTVTDKVVGRVMNDVSNHAYGSMSAPKSALKVSGMPGTGSLPGRSNSLGSSVTKSVTGVAKDTVGDSIENTIGKVFSVFDRDNSPSR